MFEQIKANEIVKVIEGEYDTSVFLISQEGILRPVMRLAFEVYWEDGVRKTRLSLGDF